jgi:HK97 family phage portal protein
VQAGDKHIFIKPEFMLHIPGLGDGIQGMSPIAVARESIGAALGVERFGSAFFGNAIRPSGLIKSQGRLSDQARANIRQSIEYANSQPAQSARLMILEEGLSFDPFSFNNEDYQFLETRRYSTEEMSRWFNISPTRLRDLQRATWANLSTEYQDFHDSTLRPWVIKWEQELERKLLTKRERSSYYVEFYFDGVLRADPETRFKIYDLATGHQPILTVDECRARENLNPMEEEATDTPADMQQDMIEQSEATMTEGSNGNQSDETNPTGQPAIPGKTP